MRRRKTVEPTLTIGSTVTVKLLGHPATVDGQVWSLAPEPGYAWVALSNGQFGKVSTIRPGMVLTEQGELLGEVAAA